LFEPLPLLLALADDALLFVELLDCDWLALEEEVLVLVLDEFPLSFKLPPVAEFVIGPTEELPELLTPLVEVDEELPLFVKALFPPVALELPP
jgi:hypothetical protein